LGCSADVLLGVCGDVAGGVVSAGTAAGMEVSELGDGIMLNREGEAQNNLKQQSLKCPVLLQCEHCFNRAGQLGCRIVSGLSLLHLWHLCRC